MLTVLAVAALYVLAQLLLSVGSEEPIDWTRGLGAYLGPITGLALVSWWQRRRLGGRERVAQYFSALRRGRLPDDADPAVWRPLVEKEQRAQRRGRGYAAVWAAVLVVGAVSFSGAIADDLLGRALVVAGALLLGAVAWLAVHERARQVQRLLDQLPDAVPPAG